MKIIRGFWDFFYGTLLIAGAPFCGIFIVEAPLEFIFSRWLKYDDNKFNVGLVFGMLFGGILPLIAGALAFCFAVQYRARHRVINRGFLGVEIVFALIAGFFFFALLGVLLYPG